MSVTADAFSLALVHSLWQDAIVAFMLWGALATLRHRSANARYVVCCAALALMAVLPVATTMVLAEPDSPLPSSIPATAIIVPPAGGDIQGGETVARAAEAPGMDWIAWLRPWMLPMWLAGVLACSLRLVLASLHVVALKRRSVPEQGPLASTVALLAARIGISRSVSVRVSTTMDSPATLGFWRPVILLPPATALGVTPQQLEALLAHELAHVRRHDYLVNALQMVAETLFFYHPAVWWASKRIRIERELCCDDIAVDACGDAVGYAQALTTVARLLVTRPGIAVSAAGGPLLLRIQRLLGVASAARPVSPSWVASGALVMIVGVLFTASYAQSPAPGTLAPTVTEDEAVLRGRVVEARSGQPIAGAHVRAQYITGVENPPKCPIGDCEDVGDRVMGRIPIYRVTAGTDGRFNIPNVKPGDYLVAATASGYVQRYFGQSSDDMPEMSIHVAAGERTSSIDVRLEPAGSVSGRVFSDTGEGLAGVEVELWRRAYIPGGSRPVPVAFAQTEDKGTFRFRDVTTGEYYVRAYASGSVVPSRKGAPLSYVATFYPEATDVTIAQPLLVSPRQEVAGVDFALKMASTHVVSGRLVDPAGASMATAFVQLMSVPGGAIDERRAQATPDGHFRFAQVPQDKYMLVVGDTAQGRSWNGAVRDISVHEDVTDLLLVAGPRVSIEGRFVSDAGRPLPFDATDLQISTEQRTSDLGIHSAGFAKVAGDGAFSMQSGAGSMHLRIVGLPPRWFVKSVLLDGVDVTAAPFDLAPGDRRRFEITLSDRVSGLSGTVTDRSARPVSNALVVIIPEDRARWNDPRSIRTTFSHQQGRYEFDALPRLSYRVVAVTSLPRNAWTDPEVIARLWPLASSVSLDELGQGTLHLRVEPPPADLIQ